MKIAYFTDTYYPQPNGVATFVGYCVKTLIKKGHLVQIFAPRIKGYKDKEKYVHRIPSVAAFPGLPDNVRLPLPIPHKTLWKIASLDFELVHAHGNGLFSLIGLAVARAKKVPYILTFHTQIGRYTHYFLKGKVVKPSLLNAILLKRFGNLCDGVITPSQKMKDELINAGVKKEVIVIPNFLDLSKFETAESGFLHKNYSIPKDSKILLSVGRLGKEKNFDFLLQIFKEIYPHEPDCFLVVAGEGLEKNKLVTLAKKLKIDDRVIFTGAIDIEKMPLAYADSDMFVFPSTSEVHPMVAIEAAVAKLPLIVADDNAFDGLIVDGKNGYRLPLNKKLFAEKIISLLHNKNLCREFGTQSREIAKSNYDPEVLSEKLVNYYSEVLKKYKEANGNAESKIGSLWKRFAKKLDFIIEEISN